jgi:GT2 family glycosyltransferase
MTGACTLVKRKVFEAGVDYTRIPNIHKALRGEDRHFCVRAACAGFEMWVDTHCPAIHLYTRAEYEQFKAGRR